LGYGDVDSIFSDLSYACDRVHDFQPEAVLAFSCCCRLYFLMEDANAELSPYQHVAPVVGFFTLGEIDSTYVGDDVLNATIVTVALSELPAVSGQREPGSAISTVNTSRNLNRIKRLMRFISRVTEQLYAANDELTYLASRDELTGILNRRALMARLHEEWALSFRYGTPMSLIMLDIDHFKQVNDRFGHQVGDEVLVRFTTLVQKELRVNDLFARYGGEEFIILLPQTRETEAVALAERIRSVLEVQAEQPSLPGITSSFGVAQWHGSMVDVYELLQYADRALYRAKQAGRNRVEVG
jgi:diguanylate cyclase (GGDEF)-like protein